jgi:hypothetical protein
MNRLSMSLLTLTTMVMTVACTPAETNATSNTATQTAPTEAVSTPAPEPSAPEVAQAPASRTGTLASGEHETVGGVTLATRNGQQVLTFDGSFATDNGPDLVVVLHRSGNVLQGTNPPAYALNEGDYVVIAPLKSATGNQEYVLPANVNAADFQSVAVWCRQFNATFGAAALQ